MIYKDLLDKLNDVDVFKKTSLDKFDFLEVMKHTNKVNNYKLVCNSKSVKSISIKNNTIFLEV